MQQALDNRYVAFSLFFYIALFGLYYAIYCSRVRFAFSGGPGLLSDKCGVGDRISDVIVGGILQKTVALLAAHHKQRIHLLHTLEWIEPIPDNPDLALIFPQVSALRERAALLESIEYCGYGLSTVH